MVLETVLSKAIVVRITEELLSIIFVELRVLVVNGIVFDHLLLSLDHDLLVERVRLISCFESQVSHVPVNSLVDGRHLFGQGGGTRPLRVLLGPALSKGIRFGLRSSLRSVGQLLLLVWRLGPGFSLLRSSRWQSSLLPRLVWHGRDWPLPGVLLNHRLRPGIRDPRVLLLLGIAYFVGAESIPQIRLVLEALVLHPLVEELGSSCLLPELGLLSELLLLQELEFLLLLLQTLLKIRFLDSLEPLTVLYLSIDSLDPLVSSLLLLLDLLLKLVLGLESLLVLHPDRIGSLGIFLLVSGPHLFIFLSLTDGLPSVVNV